MRFTRYSSSSSILVTTCTNRLYRLIYHHLFAYMFYLDPNILCRPLCCSITGKGTSPLSCTFLL